MSYFLVSSITLTSTATSFVFDNIPAVEGGSLQLRLGGTRDTTSSLAINLNNVTASQYLNNGFGISNQASANSYTTTTHAAGTQWNRLRGNGTCMDICDYTGSAKKIIVSQGGYVGGTTDHKVEQIASDTGITDPVTKIEIQNVGGNVFNAGTTVSLYIITP